MGRLVGALLLDFFDLVYEVVGLFEQAGALVRGFDEVGLAAIEEVEIRHGVVVIGTELDGLLQVGDAFLNQWSVLRGIFACERPEEADRCP